MDIAFITPSVSRTAGGIFEIERRLGQSLNELPGTRVSVHGLRDAHTVNDLAPWQPLIPKIYPVSGPRAFGFSSQLKSAFMREEADVAHLHALWMFTSVVVHRWGQKRQRPYIVTPNGMLEPWALRNSAWKKRLAGLLYERSMLNGAACIQANTEKEAADIRAYGLTNPIAIIPNGIDLQKAGSLQSVVVSSAPWAGMIEPGKKVLLFLSRIHPKKGLPNLLRAWAENCKAESRNQKAGEWVLAIAGWDQGGHEVELKQLATELGIPSADVREQGVGSRDPGAPRSTLHALSSVLFLGPQFKENKAACYAQCDGFILPSFSEGVPMVVLEAWVNGKPVVMTPECNLPAGFARGAAIRIETDAASIARGLAEFFNLSAADRAVMGANGERLAREQFAWPHLASEMRQVYEWMLGGGPPPGCVV